jgi:hypothetical protein
MPWELGDAAFETTLRSGFCGGGDDLGTPVVAFGNFKSTAPPSSLGVRSLKLPVDSPSGHQAQR